MHIESHRVKALVQADARFMITAAQLRSARALLGIGVGDEAVVAGKAVEIVAVG